MFFSSSLIQSTAPLTPYYDSLKKLPKKLFLSIFLILISTTHFENLKKSFLAKKWRPKLETIRERTVTYQVLQGAPWEERTKLLRYSKSFRVILTKRRRHLTHSNLNSVLARLSNDPTRPRKAAGGRKHLSGEQIHKLYNARGRRLSRRLFASSFRSIPPSNVTESFTCRRAKEREVYVGKTTA